MDTDSSLQAELNYEACNETFAEIRNNSQSSIVIPREFNHVTMQLTPKDINENCGDEFMRYICIHLLGVCQLNVSQYNSNYWEQLRNEYCQEEWNDFNVSSCSNNYSNINGILRGMVQSWTVEEMSIITHILRLICDADNFFMHVLYKLRVCNI